MIKKHNFITNKNLNNVKKTKASQLSCDASIFIIKFLRILSAEYFNFGIVIHIV